MAVEGDSVRAGRKEGGPIAGPVGWVQVTQALLARELVEGLGLSERDAARRLGVAPSAVSQYLSGKRLRRQLSSIEAGTAVRSWAAGLARRLSREPDDPSAASARVLEAAGELARRIGSVPLAPAEEPPRPYRLRRALRRRITGEQLAVALCMRLAQKSRDELTRSLFRQIASDSLRHAEIVASIETYLERGIDRPRPSGITSADLAAMIARERAAERATPKGVGRTLGGLMGLLWASMEADERKHDALLEALRSPELLGEPEPVSARRRPR